MSDDKDVLIAKLDRAARSVARLSAATKVVCTIMLVVAGVLMLYGVSRIDKRGGEDFIVFGLLSIVTTALALVFWSTAAFHGAFAQSTRVLAELQATADQLVRLQQRAPKTAKPVADAGRAEPRPATEPVQEAEPSLAPAATSSAATEPPAPAAEAVVAVAVAAAANGAPASVPPPAPQPASSSDEKECRNCKGTIRAEALRCKWCFERV